MHPMYSRTRIFLLLALAMSSAGCSLIPAEEAPAPALPASFPAAAQLPAARGEAPDASWWQGFRSSELDGLIDLALAQNLDVQAALERIEQARATLRIAGAERFPLIDGGINAARNWISGDTGGIGGVGGIGGLGTPQGALGGTGGATGAGAGLGGGVGNGAGSSYTAQVTVAYEVDLFGRVSAVRTAAERRLVASEFDRDAVALIVAADVADAYFGVLNLRERIAIAEKNLANGRAVLKLVQTRYREGAGTRLEMAQQQTAVGNQEAALRGLEQDLAVAANNLDLLLGRAPTGVAPASTGLADLSIPPIPAAQPADLLVRRPDVRRIEAEMHAANADVGAARAAMLPKLSLTGTGNFNLDPATTLGTLASGLTVPLFQGGRLKGEVERTRARHAELLTEYRKTVLGAAREADDALSATGKRAARRSALNGAAGAAAQAYEIARTQYLAGRIDFLTLLDTQEALLAAEDALATARYGEFVAAVDLYRALGGGWR